jgi:NAD-dependent deacetylase
VFELHGSVQRNYCVECGKFHDAAFIKRSTGIPACTACGGIVKPDVVLYEEPLDEDVVAGAIARIEQADMMIVGGTSLVVYPAAGLLQYFRGDALVLINRDATAFDQDADLVIHDSIGKVLGGIRV